MASKNPTVPDAWDDDWEKLADAEEANPEPEPEVKLSKSERRARHREENKRLWESADNPSDQPLFLQARDTVPLKSDFKPALKVLSRRPPPSSNNSNASKTPSQSLTTGISDLLDPSLPNQDLTTQHDSGSDSDSPSNHLAQLSLAERQTLAARQREEKQRKYAEARERLFGPPGAGGDNKDSTSGGRPSSAGRDASRATGRGRGGRGGGGGGAGFGVEGVRAGGVSGARKAGARDHSPRLDSGGRGAAEKKLFDPGYTPKPGSAYVSKRAGEERGLEGSSEAGSLRPTRAPRAPDGTGRGGFGFSGRRGPRSGAGEGVEDVEG